MRLKKSCKPRKNIVPLQRNTKITTIMDIKRVIHAHGLRVMDVADAMGVNRVTLANTINGNPTVKTLERIAAIVGCDVAEFFTATATAPPSAPPVTCPHCGNELHITLS